MELSPHVSSVRERVHFESSLEQKSFIRVEHRGARNPATRRNPVDYQRLVFLTERERSNQVPRRHSWELAAGGKLAVAAQANCQCTLHLYVMGDSVGVPTMPRRSGSLRQIG